MSKCWATAGFGPKAIIVTVNGGATWTNQSAVPFGVQLGGISCPSALRCYAAGTTASQGIIIATTDGGRAWAHHTIPAVGGLIISCPSATTCFGIGAIASTEIVVKTTNGFVTSTDQSVPSGGGSQFHLVRINESLCRSRTEHGHRHH